jgi:transcriptional regulator with XRE-family HTH domain
MLGQNRAMPASKNHVSPTGTPNPVDVHVGSRVRLRRTLLGFSQGKLGKAVGLTFQQIQKYEQGATRIGASRLYALSRVLDVPVAFFFMEMLPEISGKGGKPVPGLAERIQEELWAAPLAKRETLELVRAYYRIKDPNVRKRVFELVKSLPVLGE